MPENNMFDEFRNQMESKFLKKAVENLKTYGNDDSWKKCSLIQLYNLFMSHSRKAYDLFQRLFAESISDEYNRNPITPDDVKMALVDVANYCAMISERLSE